MKKRLTVFYSWQSDTPPERNRLFIEEAIQESLIRLRSDAVLEEALRDSSIELDSDTKNVAGSPPISDTILKKIEGCAVFIADLTFVGISMEGLPDAMDVPRLFPNPNVLIEYGYSLRSHSHSNIIGVMNTAYGKPDKETLPFDLRHMLWPIAYHLTPDASRSNEFEKLVQELVKRIGLILKTQIHEPNVDVKPSVFTPHTASGNAAVFFKSAEDLVGDRSGEFVVPEGGKLYLRLYPATTVPPIDSELGACELARKGGLIPLGKDSGWGYDRNVFGGLAFTPPENGKLFNFTQLFLSREMWGCDAQSVNADRIIHRFNGHPLAYIASEYVENCFIAALQNYLVFARDYLNLPLPLRAEAGLSGIKGYPITVNSFNIAGKSLRDSISWQAEVPTYDKPAWELLDPFFDRIWANCGVQRTAIKREEFARRFAPRTK